MKYIGLNDTGETMRSKVCGFFIYSPEFKKSRYCALFLTAAFSFIFVSFFFIGSGREAQALSVSRQSVSVVIRISEYTPPIFTEVPETDQRKLLADSSDFKVQEPPPAEKKPEASKKKPEKKKPPVKKKEKKAPEKPKSENKMAEKAPAAVSAQEEFIASDSKISDESAFGSADTDKGVIGHPEGTVIEADIKSAAAAKILYEAERRKKYPKPARRAGMEGRVRLRILVNSSGIVESVDIEASCGKVVLDNAAKALGSKLLGLHVVEEAAYAEAFTVIVPVDYYLTEK